MKLIHDSYQENSEVACRTYERLYRYMSAAFREKFIDEVLSRVWLTDDGDMVIESQVAGGWFQPGVPFDWHYSVLTVRLVDAMDYESSCTLEDLDKLVFDHLPGAPLWYRSNYLTGAKYVLALCLVLLGGGFVSDAETLVGSCKPVRAATLTATGEQIWCHAQDVWRMTADGIPCHVCRFDRRYCAHTPKADSGTQPAK